jgi:hypothetical protein
MVDVYTVITIGIILIATLENVWPLIAGYTQTPRGFVFLGTIHHPADYFYYLSQFAQGSYRFITSVNLFSGEQAAPTFVGWNNVLAGRIFHVFGFSPLTAYHVSVILFTALLFLAGYLLLSAMMPKRPATLALFLFALFHAFPVLRDGQRSYGDYWNNFAVPRVRLGGVPHQLLLTTASFFMVYFFIVWIQRKNRSWHVLAGLGVSSLILASLQPVLWVLVTGIAGLSLCIHTVITTKRITSIVRAGTPMRLWLTVFISGLPPLFYLNRLFSALPFSQLRLWEAHAQTALTPEHVLTATGPILLIALFSLPHFITRPSFASLFTGIFSVVSFFLFLSPIPQLIGISHVRFMSALTILCISGIAAHGITSLWQSRTRMARMTGILIVAGTIALLIPNHFKTLELSTRFDPNNAYYYLTDTDYEFLKAASSIGNPEDTFLVAWPYNSMFPAIAGRRTFHGHPLLTIDSAQKDALASRALGGSMTSSELRQFLKDSHISYVLTVTDNRAFSTVSFLTRVTASKNLVVYRVL